MPTKRFPIDLMTRITEQGRVTLWYHGESAEPKITIEVMDSAQEGGLFVLEPEDNNCMDMYKHPYSYMHHKAA